MNTHHLKYLDEDYNLSNKITLQKKKKLLRVCLDVVRLL